ncbi:YHS domain protein [compost metagenome]
MKNIFIPLLLILLVSCNSTEKKEPEDVIPKEEAKEPDALAKGPYKDLKFDNQVDYYCKMDIAKYGVSDTLHYQNKLYGFCSKMCKDEFLKDPGGYLAKK